MAEEGIYRAAAAAGSRQGYGTVWEGAGAEGAVSGPKRRRESRGGSLGRCCRRWSRSSYAAFSRDAWKYKNQSPESPNVSMGKVYRILFFFPILFRGGFICVVASQDSLPGSVGVVSSPLCCKREIVACSEVSASEGPVFGAEISVAEPRDIATLARALHSLIMHSPDPGHPLQEKDTALCRAGGDQCRRRCWGHVLQGPSSSPGLPRGQMGSAGGTWSVLPQSPAGCASVLGIQERS